MFSTNLLWILNLIFVWWWWTWKCCWSLSIYGYVLNILLIYPDTCNICNSSSTDFECNINFLIGNSTDNHLFMYIEYNVVLLMINLEMLLMLLIFISSSSYWCICMWLYMSYISIILPPMLNMMLFCWSNIWNWCWYSFSILLD